MIIIKIIIIVIIAIIGNSKWLVQYIWKYYLLNFPRNTRKKVKNNGLMKKH